MSASRSRFIRPSLHALLLAVATPLLLWGQEGAGPRGDRVPPRPVRPPETFTRALEAGTRSEDGRPGPEYWQQRADYRIEAELDPATARLTGREWIRYHNRSPGALGEVLLHLEQNVHAPGARRNRRAPLTGGITIREVLVDGEPVEASHPGRGYYESATLLEVPLPDPLASGGSVEIAVRWSYTVPPAPTFRNGHRGGETFMIAQWYPRLAVYDDVRGWDASPYLGDGEFYLEYGDFDVRLTLPGGWLVGATGVLENPGEVLSREAARRLALVPTSGGVVHVVDEEMLRRGEATRGGGPVTWHFTARDVRDFAWAASPGYVWDAEAVTAEDVGLPAGTPPVLAQALYHPRLSAWRRGTEYVAHTLRSLSEWIGPYRYPQLTSTEGFVGGMEYPMLLFNPGTDNAGALASVTIHEAAHQWFPMMVGSMEARYAWMDEGFVSYWDEMSLARLRGTESPSWGGVGSYLSTAGTEAEVPLMRHTDLVSPYGARGLAAYTKPAVVLGALRAVVGDSVFLAAFRDYFRSWELKHPQPWDFFNTVERHAGRDLDWFWRGLFYETWVLDHAIESVASDGGTTTITVRDEGEVVLPTPLRIVGEDGSVVERWLSAESWLELGAVQRITVSGAVAEVVVDPELLFPDVDRDDNRWPRSGAVEGGGR